MMLDRFRKSPARYAVARRFFGCSARTAFSRHGLITHFSHMGIYVLKSLPQSPRLTVSVNMLSIYSAANALTIISR
jgi:hypothetical protein